MPNGLFSLFPGLGIQTRLVGCGLIVLWWRRRLTMTSRSAGATDFTPSTPAVRLPWLSCVTLTYRQGTGRLGFHQEAVVNCEPLCHRHDQRLDRSAFAVGTRFRSSLRQGIRAQSSIGCGAIASVSFL